MHVLSFIFYVKFESLIQKVSTLVSLVGIAVMPIVLVGVTVMINKFRKSGFLKTEEFQKKYSMLVEDD